MSRLDRNKHIPEELITKTCNLRNILLSELLRDISIEYESTEFNRSRDEYDFIQQKMSAILKHTELTDLERNLNFLRLTESMLLSRGYRDHFLHSFQVFILGEIIIDVNFNTFLGVNSTTSNRKISFERTWLLASLLHDIGIPHQHREWVEGIGEYRIDPLSDSRLVTFMNDMASYYSKIQGNCELKKIFLKKWIRA